MDDPLAPLLAPVSELRGVGPATAEKLARLTGGGRVRDLLFHLPDSFIDRRTRTSLRDTLAGQVVTWTVEIAGHEPATKPSHPHRVRVTDGTAFAELAIWDKHRLANLTRARNGAPYMVNGRVEAFGSRLSMRDPAYAVPPEDEALIPPVDPVWPMTARLSARELRTAMRAASSRVTDLPEWHDPALLRRERWPSFRDALLGLQCPNEPPTPQHRARLGYDEMLAHQLAMMWMKAREKRRPGRSLVATGAMRAEALRRFGFDPTASQAHALAEIDADMAAPRRMLRLLQGDVGSGKTLVALLAMLGAVEAGTQAALMAPTEVLAKQHLRTLERLVPCPVGLLTGSVTGAARRNLLLQLNNGRLPIVVGTHALFQEAVEFRDLGLAVIDEQHRFGVEQRLLLGGKGERTDLLVMTATPIPRTLLLTQWGEMEVSRLTEKPAGRQPIRTTLHSLATLESVIEGIGRALDRGEQVYWVCPMVTDSLVSDLAAAEARFAEMRTRFGHKVGLAHGQQDSAVRDASIAAFAAGRTQLLVATTVIEVGVDVPGASVMVVEHADRFGLAQLHQLRGRVGRGAAQSYCLLLHEDGLTETGRRRMTTLRDTEDGFVIADEDFRLRGGGDLLGKRQSGLPGFRLSDPEAQDGMLRMANQDAAVLLDRDPKLESERGQAARLLLRLFDRRAALETLGAG
ncbi:ATP-dependent DNA helicase RecG [Acidisphaera sp. L21]|uniref:ATP-dependent DNA helicase RecG n=1 Tax=Acidisphaera sp. L21 TaxID=1641851 RepID=UPI00131A9F43|nr:ATP-dependent DNA helicase RecG [Acidisphaera sp. L21]